MIYGKLDSSFFEQQAAILAKPLKDALHYLKLEDLAHYELGQFPVVIGGVPMMLQVMELETTPREQHHPEIHRKYIDVQVCVSGGPEKASFYSDDGEGTVKEDCLKTERDILFYENSSDVLENTVFLAPGSYAIYFPWDAHVPGQTPDDSSRTLRKVVLKVPMEACL
jgi:uncharacterized protein, YhcH/YjgK/YiaL family